MSGNAKSLARRDAILDRLADHMLAHGLSGSSLRPLAHAAEMSDRMLLYYFRDKAEIVGATLERVAARLAALLDEGGAAAPLPLDRLTAALPAILLTDRVWPYLALWLEVASLAARGDPGCRAAGERIMRGFLAWAENRLDSANDAARRRDAARLLVTMEGLVVLKSVGLEDIGRSAL